MVVAEQGNWVAEVVVLMEGTANICPYVESLKTNYIIPTLEYFNGGPADERDCGFDYNGTLYALVVFMAADCAPEPAATCFGPTTSTSKFLSWLDRVSFVGGGGESCSHIAEGLSTALQVFDDFQTLRDSSILSHKHCILICNSPPYPLATMESLTYAGYTIDQLSACMVEKQVNLTILSPRKIPVLLKLYEMAGGDLPHALSKNYAKDCRHLVLLRGYQLQERPTSPPTLEAKVTTGSPAPLPMARSPPAAGQKRPASGSPPHPRESTGFKQPASQGPTPAGLPSSQAQGSQPPLSQTATGTSQAPFGQTALPSQPGQQIGPHPVVTPPATSHLASLNQPNPPNVTITSKGPQLPAQLAESINRPTRGQSPIPIGPRMPWSQPPAPSPPVSTTPPAGMSVLANQLSMAPGAGALRHPQPQPSLASLVPQPQSTLTSTQASQMCTVFSVRFYLCICLHSIW